MPMLSLKDAYDQAKALYDQGSYRAAARAAEVLCKQVPNHPPAIALHIGALLRLQRYEQGVRLARRSLRHITHKPHRVAIITQFSDGLTQSGALTEAIEMVGLELERQPDNTPLIACYTHLLVMNDQHDEAIACIDAARARGIESPSIAAVFGRAVLRTERRDEAIAWLQTILGDESHDGGGNAQRHRAFNALGHLLDKAGRYDEAMEAFHRSNALVDPNFVEARLDAIRQQLAAAWTPQRFSGVRRPSPSGPRPVFIVGMPRSGTTLTEQIIDAHPRAFGAGELGLISDMFMSLAKDPANPYATGPDDYDPEALAQAAQEYRSQTAALAGDGSVEVIVDKAPLNYQYLGMIALAFPDARIIHTRRDPRDNCLSCYFQLLNTGHHYSFDLYNCGRYYRNYLAIMEHYQSLLGSDEVGMPIFENHYEQMVADQERRTRELLDFIGLPFDPACLDFHKSGRVAITLSNDQVRQPIYRSSTKRYERYASHLGPLLEGLGDAIDQEAGVP